MLPIIEENASAYSIGREGFSRVMSLIENGKADALSYIMLQDALEMLKTVDGLFIN